jgi:hypothetical protein
MSSVQIRPAQAADKPAVETLCAQIWEGEDYVPQVWDTWLADPRFGTHSLNEPVHRIAARDGFHPMAAYRLYKADSLPGGGAPRLRRLTGMDVPTAWALIDRSQRHRATRGLYEVAWKWKDLTRERLAHHLAADDGWGVDDGDGLTALALACWVSGEDVLNVGFVDGSEDVLITVLRGLRQLAAHVDYTGIRFKPVEEPALVAAAEAAGYERSWDRDLWIFELPL